MTGRIKKETPIEKISVVGKIKIGEKSEQGLPKSIDYFKVDSRYKTYFYEAYGEKPSKLEVIFLSNIESEVCNQRYEIRQKGKLMGFGDGEIFHLWKDKIKDYQVNTIKQNPDLMARVSESLKQSWNETLTLRFFLPRITGLYGVWQLTTKAVKSSIPQIITEFDRVKNDGRKDGVVGVPFDLTVNL